MAAPAVPTVEVQNVSVGVVRVRVVNKDGDFYRVYRGTAHAPTSLRIDDMDGRVWYTDAVTEDTTYYYRAKGVNIEVIDDVPTEVVSAYGPETAKRTVNDTDANDPDFAQDQTQSLRVNRTWIARGG